jgi:uncharacterized protein (TIGR03435 family)
VTDDLEKGFSQTGTDKRRENARTADKMMRMFWRLILLLFVFLLHGQEKRARLTFEVASIKPFKPDAGGRGAGGIKPKPAGQGYDAVGASVRLMISLMYRTPIQKITGGAGWVDSDLWTVDAKADGAYNTDDLHTMFQNLLADEFKLKFHRDIKEGPVYVLTVEKSGLKMKVNDSPQDFEIPIQGGPGGVTIGKRVPMEYLCYRLGQILRNEDRPVIDRTGLTGFYDFTLTFLPDLPLGFDKANLPPELLDRPNIFDALRQQLGLKLEPQKGPVTYFVIDSVQKPEGN